MIRPNFQQIGDILIITENTMFERSMFFIKIVALMFGAIFAGFTASNIDPRFLKLFTRMDMQFVTYFLIAFSFFESDFSKWWLMFTAALAFTIFFRNSSTVIKKVMDKYDEHSSKRRTENIKPIHTSKIQNI